MTRWFTADLHLGHRNIIKHCDRPFADLDEMHAALFDNWKSRVKPTDEIFVIGDLAMGRLHDTVPLAADLPGVKFLVPGNHDSCWRGHRNWRPREDALYTGAGFHLLPNHCFQEIAGVVRELCHFPYEQDDRHGDRYAEYRPKDNGNWLIHGHIHNGHWQVKDRQINVGVDEWDFAPIPETTIAEIISASG